MENQSLDQDSDKEQKKSSLPTEREDEEERDSVEPPMPQDPVSENIQTDGENSKKPQPPLSKAPLEQKEEASEEDEGTADTAIIYTRKTRRNRRARHHGLSADSDVFLQHADLRSRMLSPSSPVVAALESNEPLKKRRMESTTTKGKGEAPPPLEGGDETTRGSLFVVAPYATEEQVLNSLEDWKVNTATVYARLLWKYTPEAFLELVLDRSRNIFGPLKEQAPEETVVKREPSTTD